MYSEMHEAGDRSRLGIFSPTFKRQNIIGENDWKLNATRLEDGWFLCQLVEKFTENRTIHEHNFNIFTTGNRRDIEQLCQSVMRGVNSQTPEWVHHECDVPGCKEGMITIDGNEKLNRAMCAAPKTKVMCDVNHINLVQCCVRSPISGGKHQEVSKFCKNHQDLDTSSKSLTVSIPIASLTKIPSPPASVSVVSTGSVLECGNFQLPFSHQQLGDLPDADSDEQLVGCRKPRNVNRYFDRTAGIIAAVRPCGIVVNFTEMYTCESPTQMYIFLSFTFARGNDIKRLKYVAYDRACDLQPFLAKRQRKDVYLASYLMKHVKFFVDRFHVKGHTEPCCLPPSQTNLNCAFHPDLPEFRAVSLANSECAEQCFRWLNKYKTTVRNMKRHRFNFFLHSMINLHNTKRVENLKVRGLLH